MKKIVISRVAKRQYPFIDSYPDSFDAEGNPTNEAYYLFVSIDCYLKLDSSNSESEVIKAARMLDATRNSTST